MRIVRIAQRETLLDKVGPAEVSRKPLSCGCTAVLKGRNDERLGWIWQVEMVSKRGNTSQSVPPPSRAPKYSPEYVQKAYVNSKTCHDVASRFPELGKDPMMHSADRPIISGPPILN